MGIPIPGKDGLLYRDRALASRWGVWMYYSDNVNSQQPAGMLSMLGDTSIPTFTRKHKCSNSDGLCDGGETVLSLVREFLYW